MSARAFFESLWSEPAAAEEEPPSLCRFAAQFQTWAEVLLNNALHKPTEVGINQAKILLVDKYFEWRSVAPRAHRDKMSANGHTCLWHVFEAAYLRLREAEIALIPPVVVVSSSPPALPPPVVSAPPPPPQIAGIFIGEED
jgi:hypothetical protein